jgi:hypothetical protein
MINALFGVAYELETPFIPHLAAPQFCTQNRDVPIAVSSTRLAEFRLRRKDFEQPTSWSRTMKSNSINALSAVALRDEKTWFPLF